MAEDRIQMVDAGKPRFVNRGASFVFREGCEPPVDNPPINPDKKHRDRSGAKYLFIWFGNRYGTNGQGAFILHELYYSGFMNRYIGLCDMGSFSPLVVRE